MSPTSIAVIKTEFAAAGLWPVDLEDGSGGFAAPCPACPRSLEVRPDGRGNAQPPQCPSGCGTSRIADELHFRKQTRVADGESSTAPAPGDRVSSSWDPVDFTLLLSGGHVEERSELLRRTDGVGLLYRRRLHGVNAEPESGKGWLACAATVETIAAGGDAVYIDYEDTAANVLGRLLALGAERVAVFDHFHYVRPDEPVTDAALAELLALSAELVVIDGVTEALAVEGLNMADNQDVATFYKRLPRPFARSGSATMLVDHVVKDREQRGRYAIGAQHKLAGVDVAYRLDVAQPFGRGRDGLVKITVTKDRPGFIRQHAADRERIAMMHVTSAQGSVTVTLEPPEGTAAAFRPTVLMERISRAVHEAPGLSSRALRDAVKGNNDAKKLALEILINEGFIDARRDGQAIKHYLLREYTNDTGVPSVPNRAHGVPEAHVPPCPPPYGEGHGAPTPGHGAAMPNGHVPLATADQEALIARLAAKEAA